MLGIQPKPTVSEVVGWLLYAMPMLAYVLWPDAPPAGRAAVQTAGGALAGRRPRRSCCSSARLRLGGREAGTGGASGEAAATVEVSITDKGCQPAKLRCPRADHVQRHQ